jgi:TatD DNase family protein
MRNDSSWTDTHAHLTDPDLLPQLDATLELTAEFNVKRLLCVSVDAHSIPPLVPLLDKPNIFGSVGIHPNYSHQESSGDWERIESLLTHPKICALGETGLDNYWKDSPWDTQMANFQRHLLASRTHSLPLIIHSRNCDDEMLACLREDFRKGPLLGVMHSFCASLEHALAYIEMGLYISFSGMLTYKKNETLRDIARQIPLDRLLVETDAPYLSPEPKRSSRPNQPAYVAFTGKVLAELHNLSPEQMAMKTTQNAMKLFSRMT